MNKGLVDEKGIDHGKAEKCHGIGEGMASIDFTGWNGPVPFVDAVDVPVCPGIEGIDEVGGDAGDQQSGDYIFDARLSADLGTDDIGEKGNKRGIKTAQFQIVNDQGHGMGMLCKVDETPIDVWVQ